MKSPDFWRRKRVLVTGHTGFKGSWLCFWLKQLGADVTGFSLGLTTEPNLFTLARVAGDMRSRLGDIRDIDALRRVFAEARPEIVFHLAAQPLVLRSYENPVETYSTNVMGAVNVLECIRQTESVRSFLNVTTDKVYENKEWCWGYRESEPLDGYDPYSNSKSCSELVTHSYARSFFADGRCAVSTARAGNVIGGGDFSENRIVPDCVRAAVGGKEIEVRNPRSVRPYQHVLEPLSAYLLIAARQYEDGTIADWYNVGPDDADCVATGELVNLFCQSWGGGLTWADKSGANAPHEAHFLKLDSTKLKTRLGWRPRWHIAKAVEKTAAWTKCWQAGGDIQAEMAKEIRAFEETRT